MTLPSTRRREAYLIIGIAALYLLLWLLMPKPAFWGIDNGLKFQGMKAFAESGSIELPTFTEQYGLTPKFRSLQPPFGVVTSDGQLPVFSPLFMVLGGILMRFFGEKAPFILPLLGSLGILFVAWQLWLAQRENHDGSVFLALVGIGSPVLFYTFSLWEHTISAALLLWAVLLLFPARLEKFKMYKKDGLFLAGVMIGLSTGFRSEVIVWALIVVVLWKYTGRPVKSVFVFILGFAGTLLLVALINFWQTGVLYPLHFVTNLLLQDAPSLLQLVITRMQNAYVFLVQGFKSNLLSITCLIPIGLVIFRYHRRLKGGESILTTVTVTIGLMFLAGMFMAKNPAAYTAESSGMLWITPVVALAIMPLRGERRRFWEFIWIGSLMTIMLLSVFSPTVKGIHWGARHLLMIYPLIMMVAMVRAQRWWERRRETQTLIVVLVSLSIINQLVSYTIEYKTQNANKMLSNWLAPVADGPIVTWCWWLPGDCALSSYKKPWFILQKGESFNSVLADLKTHGSKQVYLLENQPFANEDHFRQQGIEFVSAETFKKGAVQIKRTTFRLIQ